MKLEYGKNYKQGFILLLIAWMLFSFLPFPNNPDSPAFLGFSVTILCMVAFQAFSGVALDQNWKASISLKNHRNKFFTILLGQTFIAVFAATQAF